MTSVHRGVTCNVCKKPEFSGKRFKCLRCVDYDLCSECYDSERVSNGHELDHPIQCILTNADFALYYGGENIQNVGQIQSYTCPLCGKMGFSETTLRGHLLDHPEEDKLLPVLCPMCSTIPGNDNEVCHDIATHLMVQHPSDMREFSLLFDEPVTRLRRPRLPNVITNRPNAGSTSTTRSTSRVSASQNPGRVYLPLDEQRFPNLLMFLLDRAEMRGGSRRTGQSGRQQTEGSRSAAAARRLSTDHVIADRLSLLHEFEQTSNLIPIQQQDPFLIHPNLIIEATNNNNNNPEMILPVIPERLGSDRSVITSSSTESQRQTNTFVQLPTQFLLPSLILEKENEGLATAKQRAERCMFVRELLLSSASERENDSSPEDTKEPNEETKKKKGAK